MRTSPLAAEYLEDRLTPAAADLSAGEQYFLELVNRARANPAAEAARFGIDLNEGLSPGRLAATPAPPLASEGRLQAAAEGHTAYQAGAGNISHTGIGGTNPGTRITAAGYPAAAWSENVAYNGNDGLDNPATADQLHADFFVDTNVAGRGHRVNLLEGRYEEVGLALGAGNLAWGSAAFVTQDFGARAGNAMITGVAYTDAVTANSFYTPGEGIGNVAVTAVAGGQRYTATTTASGGYSLEVPPGTYTLTFLAPDGQGTTRTVTVGSVNVKQDFIPNGTRPAAVPPTVPPRALPEVVVAGAPAGGNGTARVLDPTTGQQVYDIANAVPAGVSARVASGDFTGDGVADVLTATGPGTVTRVRILDGKTGAEVWSIQPFESAFTGGVYVAAGDLTGDGRPDVVITPDEGGGPRVDVYSAAGFTKVSSFFGIDDQKFRGGARAAVGDVDGDGTGDLLVAAGFMGGPRVAGFNGRLLASGIQQRVFGDFFAFEQTLRNGVFLAAGDLDGDGKAELIVGGGPGGGPRVTAFSGAGLRAGTTTIVANFFGGDPNGRVGVRVAVKDVDDDGRADVIVGSGSNVTAYLGRNLSSGVAGPSYDINAFPGTAAGVFVG